MVKIRRFEEDPLIHPFLKAKYACSRIIPVQITFIVHKNIVHEEMAAYVSSWHNVDYFRDTTLYIKIYTHMLTISDGV